jgi:(p)ppGpp synthase/HD superfamily hydrolase
VEFAGERHAGQRREAAGAEFIVHPIEVAALLERSGYPDHSEARRGRVAPSMGKSGPSSVT